MPASSQVRDPEMVGENAEEGERPDPVQSRPSRVGAALGKACRSGEPAAAANVQAPEELAGPAARAIALIVAEAAPIGN